MELLITDITRMQKGYICIGGIDMPTRQRVRPVLADGQIPITWTPAHGGIVDYRRVIDIGPGRFIGRAPETEDVLVTLQDLVLRRTMAVEEFLETLQSVSKLNARLSFGPTLRRHENGHDYVTPHGLGLRSLAIQSLEAGRVELLVAGRSIRAKWRDGMDLAVTDLRLFENDGATVRKRRVALLNELLQRESGFVALGLTRPWRQRQSPDPVDYHWLQVNAIHVPGSLDWAL
ncbi:MAG: hypothetical protein AB7T37_18720 [Dehalococcoidia bacterium]